jgi:curli biogenesis system outer membrane secretion channel CsgG
VKTIILITALSLGCFLKNSRPTTGDAVIDESAKSLQRQILKNYTIKDKKTIAIASFARTDLIKPNAKYRSVIPKIGILFANSLQNEMFYPDKFDLLERQRIDGLLDEVYYDKIGLTEESNKNLKLSGADYILLGTLQKREESIRIDARLVGSLDGKIVSVGTTTLPLTEYTHDLYNDFPDIQSEISGKILADAEWQAINGFIEEPSEIILDSQGDWTMTSNHINITGEGVESNPSSFGDYRLYKNFNHGALICRLKSKPNLIFGVGNWTLPDKGIIECRINDNDVINNVGSQTVTIKIKKVRK